MDVSLAEAGTLLARAQPGRAGRVPSKAKVEKRTASAEALTFGGWAEAYFKHKADPRVGGRAADSTLAMRRSVYDRAIAGDLSKLQAGRGDAAAPQAIYATRLRRSAGQPLPCMSARSCCWYSAMLREAGWT